VTQSHREKTSLFLKRFVVMYLK